MRVDFFRIEGEAGVATVNCLEKVSGLVDKDRAYQIASVPFRAQELEKSNRYWRGDMIRIRMNDIPRIIALDGEEDEVLLDDDEGIGEDTAFLYDTRTQVLAIQRNSRGVSAAKWAQYFEHFSADDIAIVPEVVPSSETINAIVNKFHGVRKLHVRVAGNVNGLLSIAASNSTANQIGQLADSSPVIELTMSMGRERGSLPIRLARQAMKQMYTMAGRVMGEQTTEIERIDVTGKFDEGDGVALNLLDYVVREEVEVEVDTKARRMLYESRQSGVDEAWGRRRSEFEERFAPRS